MIIYELVSICSALLSAVLLGGILGLLGVLLDAKKQLIEAREQLEQQAKTHHDNMEMSSLANESLGKMLQDQQEQMIIIDERVNQLAGTLPTTQAGSKWSERARRTPQP